MFFLELIPIVYLVFALLALVLGIGLIRIVFMLPGHLNYKKNNEKEQVKLLRAIAQKLGVSENDITRTGI